MLADESPSSAPMTEALDALVRIRAVLAPPPREDDFPAELDARVDGLALAAFDHYTRCREQIYDIKICEIRNRAARRFTRADLSFEDTANKSNQDNGGDSSGDKGAAR